MDKVVDRRQFVSGAAGLMAVGAVGARALIPETAEAAGDNVPMTADSLGIPWAFEVAPDPIADQDVAEVRTADVVVVGSGTSGLCCALSAAQEGLDVCVISRSAGPVARGGSNFAAYSSYMEELGVPRWNAETELRAHLTHASFDVDTRKWYRFYNHSEEAMNWLIDEMASEDDGWSVVLETGGWGTPDDDPLKPATGTHGWTDGTLPGGAGQPHVVEVLARHLVDAGGSIDYLTRAVQLVRGSDGVSGRVTGVMAQNLEGAYVRYDASKAVVLATGDFSANKDMVAKYAPRGLELFDNWGSTIDPDSGLVYGGLYEGDGQRMGLWAGAAWQRTVPCPIMMSSDMDQGIPKPICMLDASGKRFWAEERVEGILGEVQRHCPGGYFYTVCGSNYPEDFKYLQMAYGADNPDPQVIVDMMESGVENGTMVKADTIEELVEKLGVPKAAVDEINRYNEFCANGEDLDFHKRPEFLVPVGTAPYYGKRVDRMLALTVLGGLRTNENMQVCEADDAPIEGLYNVGTMVGDMFANAYTFQIPGGNLGMNCVCFGYLTGKYIANHE